MTSSGDDGQQLSLLPPDAALLIHLVRENLRLLAELASRYEVTGMTPSSPGQVVRGPSDVVAVLGTELAALAQEQLRVVLLDTKHHLIGTHLVYQGGRNAVLIHLSDCFREAIAAGATAVIFLHNHPSGDPTPSAEDERLTNEAAQAGEFLGIRLLDHIIIGGQSWVSLRQLGVYTPGKSQALASPGATTTDSSELTQEA